jgi:hypothetical protein
MAQIYASASRVLVRLGEDNGDGCEEAFNSLLTIATGFLSGNNNDEDRDLERDTDYDFFDNKTWGGVLREALYSLFQRDWFQRVWILQEVAAARRILVMCGTSTLDGHSFYLGVTGALRSETRTMEPPAATRLMQDSFTRRYHLPGGGRRFRLDTAPLLLQATQL